MKRIVTVGTCQFACTWKLEDNMINAENLALAAAEQGVNIFLLQELFASPYFCQDQDTDVLALAHPVDGNPIIKRFASLAAELNMVMPISFFEREGNTFFNSVAVIDADGSILGVYRKSHIPDGPGYQEKFYFSPGDTGFRVFDTKHGRIGVGICWDQWFPECARSLALQGAELLFFPSAIGSEPQDPTIDSRAHWTRTMQGHAAANLVPLITCNRIGIEESRKVAGVKQTFYGGSFIADETGAIVAQASTDRQEIITAKFDLASTATKRHAWGLFRDRRPELYKSLLTLDGKNIHAAAK